MWCNGNTILSWGTDVSSILAFPRKIAYTMNFAELVLFLFYCFGTCWNLVDRSVLGTDAFCVGVQVPPSPR